MAIDLVSARDSNLNSMLFHFAFQIVQPLLDCAGALRSWIGRARKSVFVAVIKEHKLRRR